MEEKNRINKFVEVIMKVARGDYSAQIELSGKHDDFDSLAVGINMMVDDIRNKIAEQKRAEEKLTSSEERLRILFEYAPDAYYLNDLKGIFIDGNKSAENMMGYKRQELVGKSFLKLKLLSLEQMPRAVKLLAKSALGKPTGPDEFILNRKDGSRITAEIRTFPVKIKDKTLVLGIARDITEYKKAEEELKSMNEELKATSEELRASNEELEAINEELKSTNETLLEREFDLGERVKELNGLYGISELVSEPGISLEEIFQGIVDIIPPSWQYPEITCARILLNDQEFKTKNFKKTTWRQASNIIMNSEQIGTLEVCYLRKKPEIDEGPFLKEERHLINAIAERVGKIIESKQVEEAMLIKDSAISSSINAIAIADLEGTLTYINNSFLKLWGYKDEKDVLGKPATQFWKMEEKAQEVLRSLRDKGHWMGELAAKRKDGFLFDIHLSSTVVKDNAGKPICMMASFEDITKRKQAEKVQASLYKISEAAHTSTLEDLYHLIHDTIDELMHAKNFFIALYNSVDETISFPYFVDELEESLPPRKKGKGLTEYIIRTGKPLLAPWKVFKKLEKKGEVELIGDPWVDWLGVPLKIQDKTIGVLTLQSYSESVRYSEEDKKILMFISTQVATAIERKRAEEQIKASLEEKEFLLKEIHHRVKNNMQVISSLLRIQASNIEDEKILEMFNVIHGRIRSMSLLYEMLYKSRDMARIDLSEYIKELTTHLFSMYRAKRGLLSLKLNVKDVYLDAKRAIPCGLIITELVSNSLKHAFPNGKKGEISVEMFSDRGKKFSLFIRDTGRGFPEELDFHETKSLGMQLVTGLVDQIDGTIKLNRAKGTEFKIVF